MNNGYDMICHSGILGMHWGVRRWQNEDGSLTDAGRAHYAKQEAKANKKAEKDAKNAEVKYYKRIMKTKNSKLTNEEILDKTARQQLLNASQNEKDKSDSAELKSKTDKAKAEEELRLLNRSSGEKFMDEYGKQAIVSIVSDVAKDAGKKYLGQWIDSLDVSKDNKQYTVDLDLYKEQQKKEMDKKDTSEKDALDLEKLRADIEQTKANAYKAQTEADKQSLSNRDTYLYSKGRQEDQRIAAEKKAKSDAEEASRKAKSDREKEETGAALKKNSEYEYEKKKKKYEDIISSKSATDKVIAKDIDRINSKITNLHNEYKKLRSSGAPYIVNGNVYVDGHKVTNPSDSLVAKAKSGEGRRMSEIRSQIESGREKLDYILG